MRPRAATSAVPISCADVKVGLIEVSSSLLKLIATVKLPSASGPLALRGSHGGCVPSGQVRRRPGRIVSLTFRPVVLDQSI
jgi:hypothetical protein